MALHKFHVFDKAPCTYEFEETDGFLQSVTVNKPGVGPIMHSRPGQSVKLHDVDVNIGSMLTGLTTQHAELGAILAKIASQHA